jgi:CubicO group peptidase (beta-lactamase class C family)
MATLLITAAACGGGEVAPPVDPPTTPPASAYFPPVTGDAWETTAPAALGWNTAALDAALDWAGTQNSSAVVILVRGRLVAERYWNGWTTTTAGPWFSAGKTVTAALVGQLAAEGRLRLDQPVRELLGDGWSRAPATEAQITVRHLLAMASGLDDSLRAVTPPGSRFYYNNPAYYQLFGVIEAAAAQPLTTVARSRLFDPVGMRTTVAVANTSVGEPGFIFAGSARDFARFGLLMLNHGRWDGTRVHADSAFLATARRPSGTDNLSYGFLWWLNGGASHRVPGPYLLPTLAGPLFPSAPTDLVAALGADDKKLYLVPSLDLVVVRLGPRAPISDAGDAAAISGFDDPFWQRLRQAIGR